MNGLAVALLTPTITLLLIAAPVVLAAVIGLVLWPFERVYSRVIGWVLALSWPRLAALYVGMLLLAGLLGAVVGLL